MTILKQTNRTIFDNGIGCSFATCLNGLTEIVNELTISGDIKCIEGRIIVLGVATCLNELTEIVNELTISRDIKCIKGRIVVTCFACC
jgi:hypothetical protein